MTNEEAIKKLNDFKYLEYSNGIEFSGRAKEELDKAFDIAINSIEENTNLKAEIERLKEDISQLNGDCAVLDNENELFKEEIEQLKSTISEMETTTAQEDDLK